MPSDTPHFTHLSREEESREYLRRVKELSNRLAADPEASMDFLVKAGILTPSGEFNPAYDKAPGYKRNAKPPREEDMREFMGQLKELQDRLAADPEASMDFLIKAGILTPSGEFNPAYDKAPGYKRNAKPSR